MERYGFGMRRWRFVWFILGIVTLLIGIMGLFLPILPGTPVLVVSVYFFMKASKGFNQWILKNKFIKKLKKEI